MKSNEHVVYYHGWPIPLKFLLENFRYQPIIWIATDLDNRVFAHAGKPYIAKNEWLNEFGSVIICELETFDQNWTESLIQLELTYIQQEL